MAARAQINCPPHGTGHWLDEMPYRALVYSHDSPQGTTLYLVAGSVSPARKASGALKDALKLHGGRCFYCPGDAECIAAQLNLDHVDPKSRASNDLIHNLVVACKDCNGKKAALPVEAFMPNAGRAWLLAAQSLIRARLQLLEEDGR
jgi:5-methylcytosine-specific restriction endonuclease McrA